MVLVLKAKSLAVISIVTLFEVVLVEALLIESAAYAGTILNASITSSSDVMLIRFFCLMEFIFSNSFRGINYVLYSTNALFPLPKIFPTQLSEDLRSK